MVHNQIHNHPDAGANNEHLWLDDLCHHNDFKSVSHRPLINQLAIRRYRIISRNLDL